MAREVAVGKRIRISKMQKQMLLAVLAASLVMGISGVLMIFFIKNIGFNGKVIGAKDEAITNYEKTIKNVGLCVDQNRDGRYSEEELKKCDPKTVKIEEVPDSLRYNVLSSMTNNKDLESVGRESLKECYNDKGEKLNYEKAYQNAGNDEVRMYQLYLTKMCSALRVIPDALPAQENAEALMSSLNQIFIISGWEPESLSPSGSASSSKIPGLGVIPVSLGVEANNEKTMRVLNNIENSIRSFDINSATISWSGKRLELRAQAAAYYTTPVEVSETVKTIYASDKAKKVKRGDR